MKEISNSYTVKSPGEIIFGNSMLDLLPEKLASFRKILLVTGKHFASSCEYEKLLLKWQETSHSVKCVNDIHNEGPIDDVERLLKTGREFGAEAVVAIGGGSVIDCAKAAAALIPLEGTCREYFTGKRVIPGKGLFFAALPTTSGTGAECTSNSVLADGETKEKKSLRHSSMLPDLALVDPLLTVSCPPSLTAASGLDAFVQAFECVTNPKSSTYSECLCLKALSFISGNLKKAFENGKDVEARSRMAEASMLTGMAFAQTGLGAVHGLAHPVGSLLHIPHGVCCAILMTPVIRWNLPCCEEKYAQMAEVCKFGKKGEDFLRGASLLAKSVGVAENFRSFGLKREHFPFIVKNCRSASMKGNPRSMSDEEVIMLLETLL